MKYLNPTLPPCRNFDLSKWKLNAIATEKHPASTKKLNNDYETENFYTAEDGGMVFTTTVGTGPGIKYSRSELREVLAGTDHTVDIRGLNANNWVTSTYPEEIQSLVGAVDGTLKATLAVNSVTTTGKRTRTGKVVIGQIHAEVHTPCRLYYGLTPGQKKGSIYFLHRICDDTDTHHYYDLIGSRDIAETEPEDGVELNEKFSYTIDLKGDTLTVSIARDNKPTVTKIIDISESKYTTDGGFMFFKAGIYNQNSTADDTDVVQATFYELEISHD